MKNALKYSLRTISNPKTRTINVSEIDFERNCVIADGTLYVPSVEEGSNQFTVIRIDSEYLVTRTCTANGVKRAITNAIENDEEAFVLYGDSESKDNMIEMHSAIRMYIDYLEKKQRLS